MDQNGPLQATNVEKFARLPGAEKNIESCHVSGCHGFFCPDLRVFLNLLFAEPVVCTPDSRGFHHFRDSCDFHLFSTQASCAQASCLWLSELSLSFSSLS